MLDESNNASASNNPIITDEFRRIMGQLGTGWRVMSREKRSMLRRLEAKTSWAIRRLRYPPNGISPEKRSHAKWCKDHGKPLPSEKQQG